ncbi:MAG: hypothetical protein AB8G11_00735 [Saprospiraceae bacterium]
MSTKAGLSDILRKGEKKSNGLNYLFLAGIMTEILVLDDKDHYHI